MNGRKNIVCDAIKFGFRALVQQISLFAIIVLIMGVISAAVLALIGFFTKSFMQEMITSGAMQDFQQCVGSDCFSAAYVSGALIFDLVKTHIIALFASVCIGTFVYCTLYLGLNKIALELCDFGKSSVKKLFSCFTLVPRTVVALLLYSIACSIGLMLFIVPGIFIGIRLSLCSYFIIDQNAGVIESLKMSYKATENHTWNLFLLCLLVALITGIPKMILSAFGPIGWIIYIFSIPFSALVYSYFYRSLVSQENNRLSDAA